jgi:formyl-CoA transferase
MSYPLLEGVRVLEMALLMPADHVAGMLADMGAEVIKIEQPPYGDYVRDLGGVLGPGISEYHLFYNRNKKSLALNMRAEEGQKIFHKLVATADVLYESGTPGSKDKLTADYESVRKTNPNIVYVSLPAYGYKGPYGHLPSHGWGVYAFTNSSPIVRMDDGRLTKGDFPHDGHTDPGPYVTAMTIPAALVRRLKTGKGSRIDIAMSDPLIYAQHSEAFKVLNDYQVGLDHMEPSGDRNPVRFNYYECEDGGYIAFQAVERKFWDKFCEVVGRPDWSTAEPWPIALDLGYGESLELEQELIKLFKTKTVQDWMSLLGGNDIPVIPGYNLKEVLQDRHVKERNLISEVDQPGFGHVKQVAFPILMDGEDFKTRPAPWAGKDNEQIIKDLGYSGSDIAALKESKIIAEDTRLFARETAPAD